MIVMKLFEDQRTGPVIVCDKCGCCIKDATLANAVWDGSPMKADSLYRITFLCKNCDATSPRDMKAPCWQDLSTFLVYLLNNTGMTDRVLKQTKQQMRAMDVLG